jgi:hypothetical protein
MRKGACIKSVVQKMDFCFTNISAEILLHILRNILCPEHHILAHFCQMLLPIKALEIMCAKAALLWRYNVDETDDQILAFLK